MCCCYKVSHLLVHLGWVHFDLDVPPSRPGPVAYQVRPNSYQNWADAGTLIIEVNPTTVHEQMGHPVFPQFLQRLRDQRAGVGERERLGELRAGRGGLPHGQPHQPQVSSLEMVRFIIHNFVEENWKNELHYQQRR